MLSKYEDMDYNLVEKYNIAVPRYTSYPPVPNWTGIKGKETWLDHIGLCLQQNVEGISLYIHLPYCEKLCTYCGCNKRITKNHQVEEPYIETVLHEWAAYVSLTPLKKILIKELHLGGGTPTFFSPENLRTLIEGIFQFAEKAPEAALSFEAHPSSTSREHLEVLYSLGFQRISIGVQDLSPRIMKAINRDQTEEQIDQVVMWSREIGYTSINFDLIYGLPFQNEGDIHTTMAFVAKSLPDRIAFYGYAHVPWKSAGQRAFGDGDVPVGIEKYNLKALGYQLLEDMGYKAIGMDHFALPNDSLFKNLKEGKLHRNFMGYTDQHTSILLGLGASAISETADYYVQNEKTIEAYTEKVYNDPKLAITNAHHLTEIEKRTKNHILNLMCRMETQLFGDEQELVHLNLKQTEIQELEDDGLIELSREKLRILPKGRDFIRNICAAMDPAYFWEAGLKKYSTAT